MIVRTGLALTVAAVAVAAGTVWAQDVNPITTNVPEGAAAVVNGEVIPEKALIDLLIARSGRQAVEQLIVIRLIDQELKKRGLKVTDEDIQTRLQSRMAEMGGEAAYLKRIHQAGVTLDYVKGYELKTEIALRKLTAKDTVVTEEEIKKAFTANYGEKRQIRRIELNNILIAADVAKQLDDGADFEGLVRKHSINAQAKRTGGLTNPFGRGQLAAGLKAIEDTAFELEPGKTSGVIAVGDKQFFIIKLEKVIPARTDVKLDDVREALTRAIHNRKVTAYSGALIKALRAKARIGIREGLMPTK